MKVNGIALGITGVGIVFVYSGVSGRSVLSMFQNVVTGKSPQTATAANQFNVIAAATGGTASSPTPGAASPSGSAPPASGGQAAIAADAMRYVGHVYHFGGPSNPTNGWDCSSFALWVVGHDMNLPTPGGTWAAASNSGKNHGPTAAQWKTWGGATNIARNQAQPGDLLCWDTHIGFVAPDGQHMISAYDTASGTLVTGIDGAGPGGETLQVRRLKVA